MRNKFDRDGSAYRLGVQAEDSFVSLAKSRGWEVKEANAYQNMREHWDYLLTNERGSVKVDVKSEKRINRGDTSTQTEWLWIELKNVGGNNGWLYGMADYIAFQNGDSYWLVKRKALAEKVEELISDEVVSVSKDARYKRYTRKGRKDVITLIKFSDIEDIVTKYDYNFLKTS